MKILVLGSLGVAACWSGSSSPQPVSPPRSSGPEIAVAAPETEPVVGRTTKSEAELAREQAIEQARAAGILGSASDAASGSASGSAAPAGSLAKESIRREIRAHLRPITLCYEQRLLEDPSLQGTTKVLFAVGADGHVTSSVGSGFDAKVDSCVADVIKGIVFPAPASGGMVQVSYPFVFRPAGG
jgi:outer membrane biosynthesis protein TonB